MQFMSELKDSKSGKHRKLAFETLQVHAGQEAADSATGARAVPIYATSSYTFKDSATAAAIFSGQASGYQYGRMHNPTVDALTDRLVALCGAVGGTAFSSGQAAETAALMAVATPGAHFVLSDQLFGGTYAVLKKVFVPMGCTISIVEPTKESVRNALRPETSAVWVETIANPSGTVPDLPEIAAACRENQVPLFVDNTFGCAGYLCNPLEFGADVVIESATKWIGGHGTFIAGVVLDGGTFNWGNGKFPAFTTLNARGESAISRSGAAAFTDRVTELGLFTMGMTLSPFAAFLALQGLESLSLRVQRACDSALALAHWLVEQPGVDRVLYPGLPSHPSHAVAGRMLKNGFGGVLAFDAGSHQAAQAFIDRLELASHLANIGDAKTLVIHPWTTTHAGLDDAGKAAAGITDRTVRVSVGLEALADLEADFARALA